MCSFESTRRFCAGVFVVLVIGSIPGLDDAVAQTPPQEAPSSVAASDGTYPDRVRISWRLVSGATEHEVFRSDTPGGVRTLIGSFTGTTTEDFTGDAGTIYYYSARGKNQWGTGPLSGENPGHRSGGGSPSGDDYRPDCLIGTKPGQLRGDDVFDPTGNRQRLVQRSRNGRRLSWFACFENDGSLPDDLNGRGLQGNRFFNVKYREGSLNITGLMFLGQYQAANLVSGEKKLIRIDVKPTRRARGRQKARTFAVTLTSVGEPGLSDRAKPIARTVK